MISRRLSAAALSGAVLLLGSPAHCAPVKAKIDSGVLVGTDTAGVLTFKGIPYAAAPVGALRWAPTQRPAPWFGERAADTFGEICPQPSRPDRAPNEGGAIGPGAEDCLFLNVWAPKGARKAPVMVWLHGGGNAFGAGSLGVYDGSAFVRDGVILVTMNYRLGALGFFAHPALTKAAPPDEPLEHYGIMDQIAALEWVRRNIAAFGGDPANVTVFGESAGGEDILTLMATPLAQGLFAKAIVESGGGWSPPKTLAAAEASGEALALKAGAPAGASIDQLRALPAQALVSVPQGGGGFGFVVDGRLLTETPAQAFAAGHYAHVPLIIGSNSYEASLIKTFKMPVAAVLAMTPEAVKPAYAELKTDEDKADAMFTDAFMGAPARWIAGQTPRGPAWLYHFSYVAEAMRPMLKGTPHAFELPFVFDSWDHLGAVALGLKPAAADLTVTRLVHACWITFARTGTPTCAGGPAWPAYSTNADTLIDFDTTTTLRPHFRKAQYDALEAATLPTLRLGE
jgi:para-nitrobenzyl esterase